MKKLSFLLIVIILVFSILFCLTSCSENNEEVNVPFYRKVAREVHDDGWVFTFVYNGLKDPNADDSDTLRYQFFGINIRYRYDDKYIQLETHTSENGDSVSYHVISPILVWGTGSEEQSRDMQLVKEILDNSRSAEEILLLSKDDFTFEELDGEMFFRLVKQALTGDAQKEGSSQSYWDKPSYAFLEEPLFTDGYKFQVAFLQETGCIDELYIDILYKTGDGYRDYVQLSDLVESGTATAEQTEVFNLLCSITADIKDNEVFTCNNISYSSKKIGEIELSRLSAFLKNIHNNEFTTYTKDVLFLPIEGATE